MKRMKCIHPIKVRAIMENFLNFASDLDYEDENGNSYKRMAKTVDGKQFSAFVFGLNDEVFEIEYCFDHLMNGGGTKQFRKNFVNHCPASRGFATITMNLLHELGHFETLWMIDYDEYDRIAECKRIMQLPKEEQNWEYFKLPDETAATNWAIEWLAKKENRAAAKRFEREFFACFSTLN